MASGQYQVRYSVTKSGDKTNGLFPPIVCTGTGERLPNINITFNSPSDVSLQVIFPGDADPVTIELQYGPVGGPP